MPLLSVPDLGLSVEPGESVPVVSARADELWRRLAGAPDRAPGAVLYKGQDIEAWSAARRRAAGLLALFEAPLAPAGMTVAALVAPGCGGRGLRAALREAARRLSIGEDLLETPLDDARWRPLAAQAEWLQAACLKPALVVSAAPAPRAALELMRELGAAVVLTARRPS